MNSTYNLKWLFENIKTEYDAAKFLQEKNIIPQSKKMQNQRKFIDFLYFVHFPNVFFYAESANNIGFFVEMNR